MARTSNNSAALQGPKWLEEDKPIDTILRVKLGIPQAQSVVEPRVIDWAQITKFHQDRDKQTIKREQEKVEERKRVVRKMLQEQIGQRRLASEQQREEALRHENQILGKCQEELQAERTKEAVLRRQRQQEKLVREQFLQ